jgi:hypothetical protein
MKISLHLRKFWTPIEWKFAKIQNRQITHIILLQEFNF